MKKLSLVVALILIFALVLIGCADDGAGNELIGQEADAEEIEAGPEMPDFSTTEELENIGGDGQGSQSPQPPQYNSILEQAVDLVHMITSRDYDALALQVHPNKGLRFSPEVDVKTNQDLVFPAAEVPGLLSDPTERTWGYYWGAGYWMHFPFLTYHEQLYEYVDFNNPNLVGLNQVIGQGTLANNISSVYPNAQTVEFYVEWPEPDYDGGINWRSLTLVFETVNNQNYLVGLVSGFFTD